MTAPIVVSSGAATDVGSRRTLNEDSHFVSAPVFVVADGMGGHEAGDLASAAAVNAFAPLAGRESVTVDDVRDAFDRARRSVDALSEGRGEGAGTTFAGVLVGEVDGSGYWIAINLGDSRIYRLREGALEQISVDHSVVQELIDSGELTPEAAAIDRRRNVITRAMGAGSEAEADYWMLPASPGDRILICTDGMSNELSAERIATILRLEARAESAAARLVQEALLEGGRDNITAVVVDAESVRCPVRDDDSGLLDEDTRPREAVAG